MCIGILCVSPWTDVNHTPLQAVVESYLVHLLIYSFEVLEYFHFYFYYIFEASIVLFTALHLSNRYT